MIDQYCSVRVYSDTALGKRKTGGSGADHKQWSMTCQFTDLDDLDLAKAAQPV